MKDSPVRDSEAHVESTEETLGALLGQGRTAEVFEWGGDRVVKLFRRGFQEHAPYEAEVAMLAHELGCPTPAPGGKVQVGDRMGLIFERARGGSLMQRLACKPWRLRAGARALANLHAAVHRCKAPSLSPLLDQLCTLVERAEVLTPRQREAALDAVRQMPDGDRLCHGDMHPGNVMEGSGGAVAIDWGTAGRGHPLVDVAVTALIMRLGELPPGTPWLLRRLVPILRRRVRQDYLQAYGLSNEEQQRLEGWRFGLAAARLGRNVEGERRALLEIIRETVR